MQTGRRHMILVLAMVGLALSPALAEEPVPMSQDEVKTLLTGNSLAGNGKDKDPAKPYDWMAYYAENGTLTLRLKPEWGGLVMKGKWWFNEAGHHCRQFEIGQKKQGCWRFQREGKFVRFVPTSGIAVEGRAIMIKGNALK